MNKKRILMIVSLVLLVSLAIVLFVIFKNKDNHNDKEQKTILLAMIIIRVGLLYIIIQKQTQSVVLMKK